MSHHAERSEKICLNCNAELHGRYCHSCGQENTEPNETLWSLITHYFYDITHFDGKFFSTLKYLILRPGFLSSEFMRGRRASYLHPIRMYVFTSAFFFLIFFSIFHFDNVNLTGSLSKRAQDSLRAHDLDVQEAMLRTAETAEDSADIMDAMSKIRQNQYMVVDTKDSTGKRKKKPIGFKFEEADYETEMQYDSAQNALPEEDRDGWLERRLMKQRIAVYQKYQGDTQAIATAWLNKFMHSFPQLFFISLPIFAFCLYLLFLRRRKHIYYTSHVILTFHLYIFTYIMLLFFFALQKLNAAWPSAFWGWMMAGVWIWIFYYIFRAMKKFYKQSTIKTLLKYFLVGNLAIFFILLLFIGFVLLSVFQI